MYVLNAFIQFCNDYMLKQKKIVFICFLIISKQVLYGVVKFNSNACSKGGLWTKSSCGLLIVMHDIDIPNII